MLNEALQARFRSPADYVLTVQPEVSDPSGLRSGRPRGRVHDLQRVQRALLADKEAEHPDYPARRGGLWGGQRQNSGEGWQRCENWARCALVGELGGDEPPKGQESYPRNVPDEQLSDERSEYEEGSERLPDQKVHRLRDQSNSSIGQPDDFSVHSWVRASEVDRSFKT